MHVLQYCPSLVPKLADELRDKHGDTYNRIQYKLWAEALDVKQYDNMEQPPPGSIWRRSTKDVKRTTVSQQVSAATAEAMNDAFTSMALSIHLLWDTVRKYTLHLRFNSI